MSSSAKTTKVGHNSSVDRFVMVGAMLYGVVRLQFRLQNPFKPDS
jgi:hypothetical protein